MFLEPGLLLTLALAVIGGIVWAVRIEGRVNGHQTLFEERDKQAEDRYTSLLRQLTRIESDQDRSDIRLDRADLRQDRYEKHNEK